MGYVATASKLPPPIMPAFITSLLYFLGGLLAMGVAAFAAGCIVALYMMACEWAGTMRHKARKAREKRLHQILKTRPGGAPSQKAWDMRN